MADCLQPRYAYFSYNIGDWFDKFYRKGDDISAGVWDIGNRIRSVSSSIPRIAPVSYNSIGIGNLPTPAAPDLASSGLTWEAPEDLPNVSIDTVHSFKGAGVPQYTIRKPTLYFPDRPDDINIDLSGIKKPVLDDTEIPPAPTYTLPNVPDLTNISIPTLEEIELPTFTGTKPDIDFAVDQKEFSYNEELYASELFDNTKEELLRELRGGVGLPEPIWQSLVDRAIARNDQNLQKGLETVSLDAEQKGWSLPSGVLMRRRAQAIQENQDANSNLIRDIFIKEAEFEIANLQFAVAQGIAFETMSISLHNAYWDRQLRVAELAVTLTIEWLNAKIALANAELQIWITEAEIHKTLIEAELLKLEKFKGELEAARLVNDINNSRVQLYIARLEAITKQIDIYLGQIEAVKSTSQNNQIKLQTYITELEAETKELEIWKTEWEGVEIATRAEGLKVDLYGKEVDAFSTRISAYSAENQAEGLRVDADVSRAKLQIDELQAYIGRRKSDLEAQLGRVQAQSSVYDSYIRGVSANYDYFGTLANAYSSKYQLQIQNSQASAEVAIKNQELGLKEIQFNTELQQKALEGIMNVNAQLAAAAYSAINVSRSDQASIGTTNESISHGYNYQC